MIISSRKLALPGPAAALAAAVSYRRLNLWQSLGYLTASGPVPKGRTHATFTGPDIARMAALYRVGQAGVMPSTAGPVLVGLEIPDTAGFIVFSGLSSQLTVRFVSENELIKLVCTDLGPHVVVDTSPYVSQLSTPVPATKRKSA
jgi:hypothetical protein